MGLIRKKGSEIYESLKHWFYHETWALPVDIFRVLFGVLSIFYFTSLILEVEDFSRSGGFINHEFFLDTFWWLKINLIQPWMAAPEFFYLILGLACFLSLGLIIGYRVRLISAILFVIATCVQRWNFPVMYVDDATMHLVFFWLILLPVGRTLVLGEWIREGRSCLSRWSKVKVPGLAVSCLIANICWIYFLAGVTKLTSEMWREGFAMYPILLLPISRMPDFWGPEHLPFLRMVTYMSHATEIVLPFLLLSPKWSLRKWTGLVLMLGFHIGIIATLKIPFANIALAASAVLFFREELMEVIHRSCFDFKFELGRVNKISKSSVLAVVFVFLVIISTCRQVPVLKHVGMPMTKVLWTIGVVQNYYLFNWIARFSYHLDQEALFYRSGTSAPVKIDPAEIIPRDVRHTLAYLRLHDIRWILRIPPRVRAELKRDIRSTIRKRACRSTEGEGIFVFKTTIHWVAQNNVNFERSPQIDVMRFGCSGGNPVP